MILFIAFGCFLGLFGNFHIGKISCPFCAGKSLCAFLFCMYYSVFKRLEICS